MSGVHGPRVVLFVGPSLADVEIAAAFGHLDVDVTIHPPVEQGDILRLLDDPPDVIGLLDGQFFHTPAVLHREILLALERGVRVLGAASIGALRAAELDVFGMEGVGEIYRLYRTGAIDGDDEVAVAHADASEGFRPLSEALVSLRYALVRAQRHGVISPKTAGRALVSLKRMHFTDRTCAATLAAVPDHEREALARFLETDDVNLKQLDARRLVRCIADRLAGLEAWPPRTTTRVNRTSHFQRYRREYEGRAVDGRHVANGLVLGIEQIVSRSFPRLYRRVARRCLALDEAHHRGLVADDPGALVERYRAARRLTSDAHFQAWLRGRWLSSDELATLLHERALEARVLAISRDVMPATSKRAASRRSIARAVAARTGRPVRDLLRPLLMYPGMPWSDPLIGELKLVGRFAVAAEVAARMLENSAAVFERQPWLADAPIRSGLLLGFLAECWGVRHDQLEAAMFARGIPSLDDVAEAARHAFIYERTSTGSYDPAVLATCFLSSVPAP